MKAASLVLIPLIVGLFLGEEFPDIDQGTQLLTHRSILTHGLMFPLVLYGIAVKWKAVVPRMLAVGFCLGVAVHLGFDLFPRTWQGYALVHVPILGWTHTIFSWSWIAISMTSCLYMTMRLSNRALEWAAIFFGLIGWFFYINLDERTFWGPLLAILVGAFVALVTSLWKAADSES